MKDRYLLYLSGPITGLSWHEATAWRRYVRGNMPPSIMVADPLRDKAPFLENEQKLADDYSALTVLASPKGITTRDRFDCQLADMVLVYFEQALKTKTVSIGSILEIAWADAWRKPIVVVMTPENVHWHSMIREVAGYIVPTLDEAISVIRSVLHAPPHGTAALWTLADWKGV